MPYSVYKLPTKMCYGVKNTETGKIHSYCTTKKKAEAQIRILKKATGEGLKDIVTSLKTNKDFQTLKKNVQKPAIMKKDDPALQGDGIIQDVAQSVLKGVSSVVSTLNPLKKRTAGLLPPKSRQLLSKIRDETITSLVVVRTPIESYINKTLQFVSGGTWQNAVAQTGYDTLFHLSLFINNKYVYHKIEVTTLATENPIKSDSQTMNVPLSGTNITIGQLEENTKSYMGSERYTNYHPATENCQDFIMAVLKANRLSTPELEKFVKQDAVSIFNKTPKWTSYIAKAVTELGSRVNRLVEGESVKIPVKKQKKNIKKNSQ